MLPTTINDAPPLDSFTSLAEHQSQTPETFFGSKPVLHYHGVGVRALAAQSHVSNLPIFKADAGQRQEGNGAGDGDETMEEEKTLTEVVDIYVSSDNLTLFNTSLSKGISLPYPAISLHAIQTLPDPSNPSEQVQGLYMQLDLLDPHAASAEDDEPETAELTIIPQSAAAAAADSSSTPSAESQTPLTSSASEIQKLFEAVSNCSNLHPDPAAEDDDEGDAYMGEGGDSRIRFEGSMGEGFEGISGLPGVLRGASDGGLPPPFPGSGGWITAENVSEYFDEEGNWIGNGGGEESESLGEGAGRVRARDEVDTEENKTNGDSTDESKRPRTE